MLSVHIARGPEKIKCITSVQAESLWPTPGLVLSQPESSVLVLLINKIDLGSGPVVAEVK